MAVLLTGLSAIGLAGFLSVKTVIDGGPIQDRALARDTSDGGASRAAARRSTGTPGGEDVLTSNPLYGSGALATIDCPAPALDPERSESMRGFLHSMTDCLDETWATQFGEAEISYQTPRRIYWDTPGQGPCGTYPVEGAAAFYCRANKGLYLGVDRIVASSSKTEHSEVYSLLLSHEYAHHVQGEAGILDYYHQRRAGEDTAAARNSLTRKSELQANCLGGAFLGSIQESHPIGRHEYANILDDAAARGDNGSGGRTHGSPENGRLWTAHGFDRRDPVACNTWDARDGLVE